MNTRDGQIDFQTAYPGCNKRVEQLLGHFKPCPPALDGADLASADAVFGLAFGYRMKQWSVDVAPTDRVDVEANRIPGANNSVLAEQCRQLHKIYDLGLYLQFEIADAMGEEASVEYASKRVDQGTGAVLEEFISHYKKKKTKKVGTILVVAHRHHFDRCRLLLENQGVNVISSPDQYSGYDPLEAQPRVMSPEEYIVNDFASMAGMA